MFEFHRNNVLDARNFFAEEKPPLRLNQYGFALGGPIQKDKTHYFALWERTQQTSSVTPLLTVPSLAERQGNFSQLRNSAGNRIVIYDPATTVGRDRQPFPDNQIPLNRFDPVSLAAPEILAGAQPSRYGHGRKQLLCKQQFDSREKYRRW